MAARARSKIFFCPPRSAPPFPAARKANGARVERKWMRLARSCWERAGGRRRPQKRIHARDRMESGRRRSRWTPR
eukprot:2725934-Prymnesium_polylepis.1